MKKLLILLILFCSLSLLAKEKTVLLYELNNSKISRYGDKILSPYTYGVKQKDTDIKNYIEIFKFLALKKDNLYGNTEIVNTPDTQKRLLTEGVITIKLSKRAIKNFSEVSSEIVYSLTENGVKGVLFVNSPVNQEKVFKRSDIPFTSFVLLIPYFNVLPPNTLTTGFIKLDNGKILQAEDFYKKIKKGDKKINKMIVNLVKNGEKKLKINAMKALPYTKIRNVEKLLIPNLDDKDNEIVLAALDGLIGGKSTKLLKKLDELLKNNQDDLIKLNSAKTLIASGNKKFIISGLKYFLESNDIKAKKNAIKSISKHKNSEEILLMMLDDKSTTIKLTVLEYLKTAKRKQSFERFKKLLNDKSSKVRLAASNILLTNKDYKEFGLYYQLKSNDAKLSLQAASALKKYKNKETVKNLITCIDKCESDKTAFESARTLLSFKEKSAVVPFFKRLEETPDKKADKMIAPFLKLLSKKELLSTLKENKVKTLSKEIIKNLGVTNKSTKDNKVVAIIAPFLNSKDKNIRIETIKALSLISGDKALELVLKISKDESEEVRAQILSMAENYKKEQIKDLLLEYLNDTSDDIRIKAMDLIIKFKLEDAVPFLKQYTSSSIKKVKLKALETLVTISEKINSEMEEKFQTLLDQDDDEIRVWAIYGLAKTRKKPNLPFITPYGSSDLAKVRQAVMYAVGVLDDENNSKIDMVYGGLEDEELSVRIEAAKALEKIGQKSDVEKIKNIIPKIKGKKVQEILQRAINTIKNRTSED